MMGKLQGYAAAIGAALLLLFWNKAKRAERERLQARANEARLGHIEDANDEKRKIADLSDDDLRDDLSRMFKSNRGDD